MSGVLHGIVAALKATAAVVTDTYWKYVSLLLNTTSTNAAQNNTFIDSSANAVTITRTGTPTQGSFTPYWPNGQWGNYFPGGTTNYLTPPASTNLLMTGDFTLECWVYIPGNQTQTSYSNIYNGAVTPNQGLCSSYAGNNNFNYFGASPSINIQTGIKANDGQWHHLAVVRASNIVSMYVDGVSRGTPVTTSANIDLGSASSARIGAGSNGAADNPFTGYISNLRIVKGTAVYTANFTPPTSPLTAIANTSLLTCQSNRFIDNSSNAFAITRTGTPLITPFCPFNPSAAYSTANYIGSVYINGSGNYLSCANNTGYNLGTNDFTLEFWINAQTAQPGNACPVGRTNSGAGRLVVAFPTQAGGLVAYADNISGPAIATNTKAVNDNAWHHVALVRSSNVFNLYIDGVAGTSTTNAGDIGTSTSPFFIGADPQLPSSRYYTGYISNVRLLNGTALYTANFTPPTSPLTAITNTQLLLNFSNAGIYDASTISDEVTIANAKTSNTQTKFGSTSINFDGTGSWLTTIDKPTLQLGSGDFTIEGWFYLSAINVAYGIVSKGTATTGWSVNITSGNNLQFSYTASNLTGATTLAANTWYYFAVVRSGTATGNLKVYLNGSADATSAGAVTDNFNQTNIMYVGADRVGGSALNGYLDQLRITNGFARTISTPTAAFPTQ